MQRFETILPKQTGSRTVFKKQTAKRAVYVLAQCKLTGMLSNEQALKTITELTSDSPDLRTEMLELFHNIKDKGHLLYRWPN